MPAAKLRRNGFEVLFSASYTAVLLPLMIASRLWRETAKTMTASIGNLPSTPLANRLFTAVLRTEVRATLAGWDGQPAAAVSAVGRAV